MLRIPVFVTRHPIASLILPLLLLIPLLARLPHVQSMDNVDDIILEDHPDTTFYESIKDTFGDDEFFVIAFSIPDLFTPHVLRSISDITTALEDIPEVREVQSLANVDYIHGAEDYFEVRPFLETIPDDPEGLHLLRLQALENPLYVGNLVSKDARSAAIVVFPKNHDAQDGSFRKRLLDQAQSVLSRHEALIGQFHLAGWTLTNLTLSQYMKTDVAVFVPVTYLFITLTVWLVFRNLRLTLLALTNISACTGATMGLFPYLGITLNTVTTIVPPLIMALALSNSVHIFSHLDRRLLDQQHDPAKSLQMILQRIILPSFLCSLTTAAGFISLAISEIPAIKDFAYAASAGMVFQFFFSFTLLPAMILRCNAERLYADQSASSTLAPFVRHLWNFVSAHPRGICTIAFILTMSAFWCASTISVETNLMENFKSSSTIRKDLDFVASNLSGVATVDISLKSPDTDAFLDPSNLAAMERIQSFAQGLDKVDLCMSFVDFLKDMNQSFHNENPQFYRIPESRELVSQYMLLYDIDDLDEFITAGYDHARILVRISDHGSAGQARIIAALQSFIDLNDNNGLQVRVTGRAVQDDPGQDRGHSVLADAEVQGAAVPGGVPVIGGDRRRPEGLGALDGGVVTARQIGRPAPQFGQVRADRGEDRPGGGPGGQRLGARLPVRQVGVPALGQPALHQPVQQRLALRLALCPRVEVGLPALVGLPTALDQPAGMGDDVVADLEALVRVEAEDLLGGGDLFGAQRRAVHPAGVHLGRRRVADDGPQRDERRFVGHLLRRLHCFFYADDVLPALDLLDVPAVGPVAGRGVLSQRDVGVVLDGDLVVVPDHDQIAQLLSAGQRGGLAGHALLDVAVGGDHTCAVLDTGQVRCWGVNASGQLGTGVAGSIGDNEAVSAGNVVDLGAGRTAVAITAGALHSCAILDTGAVRCWGANYSGQAGDGTTENRSTATAVEGLASGVAALDAGDEHVCAFLNANGGVWACWGSDGDGQLGIGTAARRYTAVRVVETVAPELRLNYTDGKPGSVFSLTGHGYAGGVTLTPLANSTPLTATVVTTDGGAFTAFLDTADADPGFYTVEAGNVAAAQTGADAASLLLFLDDSAPLRRQEGGGAPVVTIPAGIAVEPEHTHLPVVRK